MPKYAYYNSSVTAVSPVIGWIDADALAYPSMPAAGDLLTLTEAQWADHMSSPSGWAVSAGALVSYTPPTPAPTLAQQAAAMLSAGLTITSTSTPALNGAYACDMTAQNHIQAEMISILVNGVFADGETTLVWPDVAGVTHTFPTVAAFKAFATSVAAFVAACAKVVNGTLATLPAATATIP